MENDVRPVDANALMTRFFRKERLVSVRPARLIKMLRKR